MANQPTYQLPAGFESDDTHVELYMGTTWDLGKLQTVGELKGALEKTLSDLPEDSTLAISEIHLYDHTKFSYLLQDGIAQ